MKTIAFLTPFYFGDESCVGGGERYPLNLAIGLVQAAAGEFRVEILSYGPSSSRRNLYPGVTLRVMKAGPTPALAIDNVSWELSEAIADSDLIHVHQLFTRGSELAYVLAKLHGKPICGTDHGGWSSPVARQFGGLALVDHLVCYSTFGQHMLSTDRPVTIIRGGVDTETFHQPCPRPVRDRFAFVGRLLPHKGVDQLIEALPANLPLTICGRQYNDEYFLRLQHLAKGKQIEFVTDAHDAAIRDVYAKSWAVILPSVYVDCYGTSYVQPELMGLTILEAMACGTPAICSRVGGMPEFIEHGETGYVFDQSSDLTGYLRELAADPKKVERMGAQARLKVEREYDRRVCGAKLSMLYRELIAQPGMSRRVAA